MATCPQSFKPLSVAWFCLLYNNTCEELVFKFLISILRGICWSHRYIRIMGELITRLFFLQCTFGSRGKGSSILVFSGPIHNNYWFTLFVITLPIVAFFVWLLENFSKTEGLNVKIKGTSLLRAKWMYVCVFFVCFHCLPVFFFLFLFLSNNYLSLHTLRFYTGMLFCLFTKLKYTE